MLTILIPLYNDWVSANELLRQLDTHLSTEKTKADVVFVDDGSHAPHKWETAKYKSIQSVDVLQLHRNLGHQRALAIGLAYIEHHRKPEAVLIMDADGEDSPSIVPALLEKLRECKMGKIIFAERRLRSEGFLFTFFYHAYRFLHFTLTGMRIRYGNFSVVPGPLLKPLVASPELWNHFAATVGKAKIPFDTVPADRAKRIAGKSRMNSVALVVHGLSALSVHGETVMVRLLFGTVGLFLVTLGVALSGVFEQQTGWMGVFACLQFVASSVLFSFLMLGFRSSATFIPSRDFGYFAGEVVGLYKSGRAKLFRAA